ncbi:MAG: hypothetical protein KDK60_00925 [Chlamydiia bacterium]|nr:hypothetical protein [Chlamydiia bacterium]
MKAVSHKVLTLLACLFLFSLYATDSTPSSTWTSEQSILPQETGEGYTINFNNVSVIELIKFISKIGNVNFVYNEADLTFKVTIVSEEPTSLSHVMAAFVQVLRINGFDLLEQGNNLVITKGTSMRQIAPVVSSEVPLEGDYIPPIMTRVFTVKNANPVTLAGIIRPLLSENAIIEVSETSRNIIVTDITQNIEEIHKLFYSLDIPRTPLEIDSYVCRNNSPSSLIDLTSQILIPISEGNPLIFVPQEEANTIFIVTTPFLIEKSMAILEDLDTPPSVTKGIRGPITGQNILIYHILHKSAEAMIKAIEEIDGHLEKMGPASENLVATLGSVKYVKQSNSLLFTGTPSTLEEVKTILTSIDVPYSQEEIERIRGGFYIYPIKYGDEEAIARSLDKLVMNLKNSPEPNEELIQTIESMKYIQENNSLLFTGDQSSIDRLKQILPTFDLPGTEAKSNQFFIYTPAHESAQALLKQLQATYKNLVNSNLTDKAFLRALQSAKLTEGDRISFTGDEQSLARIRSLVEMMDQAKGPPPAEMTTYVYRIEFVDPTYLEAGLRKIAKSVSGEDDLAQTIDNMKYISESNSLVFHGPIDVINNLKTILPTLDNAALAKEEKETQSTYYVYKLKHAPGNQVIKELQQTANSITGTTAENKELITSIKSVQWIQSTNSLVITGPTPIINQIKVLIEKYDTARGDKQSSFYVFKPVGLTPEEFKKRVVSAAKEMVSAGLNDPSLTDALESAKVVSGGTAVMFTGTEEGINKLKSILPTFDTREVKTSEFFIYKPTAISAEQLQADIQKAAKQLSRSGLQDPELINAMESAKVSPDGDRVLFTGTPEAIDKIKVMAQSYDIQEKESQSSQYFIFKPKNQPPASIIQQAKHAADQMEDSGLADQSLITALNSATIVSNGTGVLFTGTPQAIVRIKELAPSFDNEVEATQKATQYYIFKPKFQSPEAIIKQARHTAEEMKDSGFADPHLITALNSGTLVSKGTAVLFTGTPEAIARAKEIVPTFDISVEEAPKASEFFVYKPLHISADQLKEHARMVAEDMSSSGFGDKALITTLQTSRLVSAGKAVLFTGTKQSIEKVKELLPSLDTPQEDQIKQVGKSTFLIYKIKSLSGPVLLGYLRNMATDLKRAGSKQDDLIATLNNMRYVQETNSIVFTGTPSAVQEAVSLAQKFDIPGLAHDTPVRTPSGYQIYKPKYVPGEELIQILRDFEQNLINSGIQNKELFDVINNLKWMERTSTILISGNDEDTKQVQQLLERFDTPGRAKTEDGEQQQGIEMVSDMSFLIYKLQYHSGSEIQDAIKKIGGDFEKGKGKENDNLVQAINTLQWIEVTNSLIATGQADALAKLRELIKSIDIPLKQVFVEVLVIETTQTNNLEFGLRWGSQGKYRNKFSYGGGAFPQDTEASPDNLRVFNTNLHNITATTTPTGSFIPFAPGGDLGVIGDIILHKGQSYFALGSLINALRIDGDSTIVMNQKIITQDNKVSTIFVGQNIPYTGSVVTNSASTTVQTANLEYRDVGVSLSITPVVGNNDLITLMIEEDISEQVESNQTQTNFTDQIQGIKTNKSSTKTVVSVPDKSFLVLSGSMQNSTSHTRTSIPCLGGLPLIGAAFSDSETNTNLSNLVIFVRPHIIKSFDVYSEVTARQEDLFRSQANEEDFDAGLELVKTPDDTY